MIDELKGVLMVLGSWLFSRLVPIADFMQGMLLLFLINFVFGVVDDVVKGNGWEWRKAKTFFLHILVFFVIAACMCIVGYFLHNAEEAITGIRIMCVMAVWFYGVNILKNVCRILVTNTPMWKFFNFLYWVLSLKMVEKIPYLSEYMKSGAEKIEGTKDNINKNNSKNGKG
jgi:hypothetical protein